VLAAVGFFFLPLVTTFVGAGLGGPTPLAQLLGGVTGLAVGMLLARFLARMLGPVLCARAAGGN
jgi:hypothetical protein